MKWIEIKIKTTPEAVDLISNVLYEAGITGVAIEEPFDAEIYQTIEGAWAYFEPELVGKVDQSAVIKGYLEDAEQLPNLLEHIRFEMERLSEEGLDIGLAELSHMEVDDADWAHEWKKYYKTTPITDRMIITPTWEPYTPNPGEIVITLDPGGAFGTGTHETTRLCLKKIEEHLKVGDSVLDIGSGSGILSIAALKLGASHVTAIDIDTAATDATLENLELNGVAEHATVITGNLVDAVHETFDLVVANIIAEIIVILVPDVPARLGASGKFLASGILVEKKEMVLKALAEHGLQVVDEQTDGDWCAIIAQSGATR